MIDRAQTAREVVSRSLANRLVATLADRPFVPTTAQLAWIDGGDLAAGLKSEPLARIVAGRFAILFADHVIGNVAARGAGGAYMRIVDCASQAFVRSLAHPAPARLSRAAAPAAGTTPDAVGRRKRTPGARQSTRRASLVPSR